MSGKRLELTEEERAVMVEALKFWKRRHQGRSNYARKAQHNLELQAKEWADRLHMPDVAEMRRDMIPEWQQREAATRRVKEVAAALAERINAPDDPMEQFFSQGAMDAVKAGQCGVLKEDGEVWGALVPAPVYRLVKRIREEVGDWTGAWTVVRLVEPVASDMDDTPSLGMAANLAELESVCPTS